MFFSISAYTFLLIAASASANATDISGSICL